MERLQSAIIYNVYPQSFKDSNGDGIGDLNGITDKLDYMHDLGIDHLWLNPIYPSPFGDAGYDVADYCAIAERYGTMDDFRRLVGEADARGIRVVLDYVAGHTSVEHPWFQESMKDATNPKANWYVWTDSMFGTWDPGLVAGLAPRDGRFMANFFYFQPALNYGYVQRDHDWQLPTDHPDVQAMKEAMRDVLRFWLDIGVAGFRVDMAASLVKGDPEQTGIRAFWRETREWLDSQYPEALLISEWSDPEVALGCGFDVDFLIHSGVGIYTELLRAEPGRNVLPGQGNSIFDQAGEGDIARFLPRYQEILQNTRDKGLISLPTGNHDLPRFTAGREDEDLKAYYVFQMTMPGTPTIYYGDEIGMRNITGLPSKEGGYIRTMARTPMQWQDDEANAGFSTAEPEALYLPVDTNPDRPTVAAQLGQPDSLLEHVRELIVFRRERPELLAVGDLTPLYAQAGQPAFAYLRENAGQRLLVAINPSGQERLLTFSEKVTLAGKPYFVSHPELGTEGSIEDLKMPPVSWLVMDVAAD